VRSTLALRRYFEAAAQAGIGASTFETLRDLGIAAEARMLRATRGVNTHRGAIFNLGLLAAAAGARASDPAAFASTLGECVKQTWGDAISKHRRRSGSHGSVVSRRHAVGGAKAEAAAGFPAAYGIGLPAYRAALRAGHSANQARVQAFFALVSELDDTNLLHRGGQTGLGGARFLAAGFLREGGVSAPDWRERAIDIHGTFCKLGLSPGGSGDLLAACLFIHAIEG
jgi:triphosphoribosyl-dephospho-CoA synthase